MGLSGRRALGSAYPQVLQLLLSRPNSVLILRSRLRGDLLGPCRIFTFSGVLPVGSWALLPCIGLALKGETLLEQALLLAGLRLALVALPPRVGVRLPLCISLLWLEDVILELIIFLARLMSSTASQSSTKPRRSCSSSSSILRNIQQIWSPYSCLIIISFSNRGFKLIQQFSQSKMQPSFSWKIISTSIIPRANTSDFSTECFGTDLPIDRQFISCGDRQIPSRFYPLNASWYAQLVGCSPTMPHLPAQATRPYPMPISPAFAAISAIPEMICSRFSREAGTISSSRLNYEMTSTLGGTRQCKELG